ncbi:sugar ABC transporter ATP-binding protein [Ancylobacter sp. WKF20]|uniref:sugar ABC transporter ATP-binding protein n=1 Tax=Ancylobacter sp. WKF20 TaxID=3039801 RepID=UPI0024343ADD|nr:sugar ABC transporter ATP-binding protein [Ancylobacter sp. WKF20]WGD29742.1 sugar ABC transporter ATP-binding protein [Ancylobacter sp. WKF20]
MSTALQRLDDMSAGSTADASDGAPPPRLRMAGVSKSFGNVHALRGMDFELRAGEVHMLFGENGAGKSTLINVICGALRPDRGTVTLDGEELSFRDVHDARRHGISAMFQEFSLAPSLTVEENLFLGSEPRWCGPFIRMGARRRKAWEIFQRFGLTLDPRALVHHLSRAEQQMVELAKALLTNPRILILDEPTASLSERETELLFELVRRLRGEGVGIVYITHRLSEIREIGDRITVMRDGQLIATVPADIDHERLVELMTGRPVEQFYPHIETTSGARLLEVSGLATTDGTVQEASIEARAGEIVGLAGLVGCGKSEIGRAVFGLCEIAAGRVMLDGQPVARPNPRAMLNAGLCYITSDRRSEGLMLLRSTQENITLSSLAKPELSRMGWLRLGAEKRLASEMGGRMSVRPFDLRRHVGTYSGGNQQKILIARALARSARVFIFDEPTVGIDVSARVEVYGFMKQLVEEGAAVIIISSDLPEVMHMSQRLYVVRAGYVVDHMKRSEINEKRILAGFFDTQGN